ncbi:hypothetical protein Pfo_026577 [Paulownia fortunei]|nr:hypothetical protein Pfo_026577 [Paulownia fortunei]
MKPYMKIEAKEDTSNSGKTKKARENVGGGWEVVALSQPLTFVANNARKLQEVRAILQSHFFPSNSIALPELQGEPEDISEEKARLAAKEELIKILRIRLWIWLCYSDEREGKWAGAGGGHLPLFQCPPESTSFGIYEEFIFKAFLLSNITPSRKASGVSAEDWSCAGKDGSYEGTK